MGVGLVIAIAIGAVGYLLAAWGTLWRKITPNRFLAELLATLIRFIFVVLGIVAGLEIRKRGLETADQAAAAIGC